MELAKKIAKIIAWFIFGFIFIATITVVASFAVFG